jgi:hypothetical protein
MNASGNVFEVQHRHSIGNQRDHRGKVALWFRLED